MFYFVLSPLTQWWSIIKHASWIQYERRGNQTLWKERLAVVHWWRRETSQKTCQELWHQFCMEQTYPCLNQINVSFVLWKSWNCKLIFQTKKWRIKIVIKHKWIGKHDAIGGVLSRKKWNDDFLHRRYWEEGVSRESTDNPLNTFSQSIPKLFACNSK